MRQPAEISPGLPAPPGIDRAQALRIAGTDPDEVFVLLAESHLSIHTWPEHRYAAVEVFTCGRRTDPRAGLAVVEKALRPQRKEESERPRGIMALCRPQTPAAP